MKQHLADLHRIVGQWETPGTCSHIQKDLSWVECVSWLLLITLWLEANYKTLRTFYFFHYHHSLLFQTNKSWPHEQHREARADLNQADWQAHHPMHHTIAHSNYADTISSAIMLPMLSLKTWPRMHISKSSVRLEAATMNSSMQLDVSISILQ